MYSAQMLPNGNLLICEGMNGHSFEVNVEEETVWEYINPINRNGEPISQDAIDLAPIKMVEL
ncbi:MAG: hypothetical protein ACI8P3_001251 [Saprospiraceae bacterium]|jgi:hypothetical protein